MLPPAKFFFPLLLMCTAFVVQAQDTWTASAAAGTTAGANWTTASTWTCAGSNCAGRNYPGHNGVVNDIVVIERPVNFSSTSAAATLTIGKLTIQNVIGNDARLSIFGNNANANGRVLNVSGDVIITAESTRNSILRIYDNATLDITGNLTATRKTGHQGDYSIQLDIYNSATLIVRGDFSYTNLCTTAAVTATENTNEIDIGEAADATFPTVSIFGDMNLTMNTTQASNLNMILRGTSSFTVGADGTGNMNITLINGGTDPINNVNVYLANITGSNIASDADATIDGADANLTINGNVNITLQDDTDAPDIRFYTRGNSDIVITGNITATHSNSVVSTGGTSNSGDIQFKLADNGTLSCTNFSFTSDFDTDSNNIYVNLWEDSQLTVSQDITMVAPDAAPTANYIGVEDNAVLNLGGNVNRAVSSGNNSDGAIEFIENSLAKFSGSGTQTIYGTYTSTANSWEENTANIVSRVYRRLEVANTSGIPLTLESHIAIRKDLTLTQGIISTSNAAYIVFPYADPLNYPVITCSAGNENSYIDGPVRKLGPEDLSLSLGNNNHWAPISITNISTGGGDPPLYPDLLIEYHGNGPAYTTTDATLDHVSTVEYWSIFSRDNYSFSVSADLTFNWKDACFSSITDVSTSTQILYAASRSTGDWSIINQSTINSGSAACNSGTVAAEIGSITATNVVLTPSLSGTDYNFTYSYIAGALPVIFEELKAIKQKQNVMLEWLTSEQYNVSHYEIERAIEDSEFISIGRVNAIEDLSLLIQYNFIDSMPSFKRSYYRVKSVDFDGSTSFSKIVTILPTDTDESTVFVYNPSGGSIEMTREDDVHNELLLFEANGHLLCKLNNNAIHMNKNLIKLEDLVHKSGLYLIIGKNSDNRQVLKIYQQK